MQKKQKCNLKNLAIFLVILIACSISIIAQDNISDSTDAVSTPATVLTPQQIQNQQVSEATNNIQALIDQYKTVNVDYEGKTKVYYDNVIKNSIDANIAARALFDQAIGFIKIAEFKKDYEVVPNKALYPAITPEDTKNGIQITKFDAIIEDKMLRFDSEFKILKPSDEKEYSINYMVSNIINDKKRSVFIYDASKTIQAKGQSGQMRISKDSISFDGLKLKNLDISKGIDFVDLYVYESLNFPGDVELNELSDKPPYIITQSKSMTETAQEITQGTNTEFTSDFVNANKVVLLTTNIDSNDKDTFYYQFEFTPKSGPSKFFPENKVIKAEMTKQSQTTVPYDYLNIKKDTDMKSIKLNVYSYVTDENTIYFKEKDFTAKSPSSSGPECTKCNDDGKCTLKECTDINKDSCAWVPDTSISMNRFQEFLGNSLNKIGSNALSDWREESGTCKDKKSLNAEETCLSRCESRSCTDKETKCTVDKKCIVESDKCVINPNAGTTTTVPKTATDQLKQLKTTYGTQITNAAEENKIDESIIYAIILSEAIGLNPESISDTGCVGLMQICDAEALSMPDIFDINKIDKSCSKVQCAKDEARFNADNSIRAGARVFVQKRNVFNGYKHQDEFAIASYNIGQGVISDVLTRLGSKTDTTWDQVANEMKPTDLDKYKVYSKLTPAEKDAKIAAVKKYVPKVMGYSQAYKNLK